MLNSPFFPKMVWFVFLIPHPPTQIWINLPSFSYIFSTYFKPIFMMVICVVYAPNKECNMPPSNKSHARRFNVPINIKLQHCRHTHIHTWLGYAFKGCHHHHSASLSPPSPICPPFAPHPISHKKSTSNSRTIVALLPPSNSNHQSTAPRTTINRKYVHLP